MYTQLTQNGRTLVKYLGLKAVIFVMIVWLTFGPKSLCCYSLQNRIGADTNAWASESRAHFMALHWNPRHAEQLQRWESALWHQASISSVVLKTESSIFITYIFSDMKVVHDFPKSCKFLSNILILEYITGATYIPIINLKYQVDIYLLNNIKDNQQKKRFLKWRKSFRCNLKQTV